MPEPTLVAVVSDRFEPVLFWPGLALVVAGVASVVFFFFSSTGRGAPGIIFAGLGAVMMFTALFPVPPIPDQPTGGEASAVADEPATAECPPGDREHWFKTCYAEQTADATVAPG